VHRIAWHACNVLPAVRLHVADTLAVVLVSESVLPVKPELTGPAAPFMTNLHKRVQTVLLQFPHWQAVPVHATARRQRAAAANSEVVCTSHRLSDVASTAVLYSTDQPSTGVPGKTAHIDTRPVRTPPGPAAVKPHTLRRSDTHCHTVP
jgi:hypothetical protein